MILLHNIYLVFAKELNSWETELKRIVTKEDSLYLLGTEEEKKLCETFSLGKPVVCYVKYDKEDVKEVCKMIKKQYVPEKELFKVSETRIVLLSSQKQYFNQLKMDFLKEIYSVGRQNSPGKKTDWRINPNYDKNKTEIPMESFVAPTETTGSQKEENKHSESKKEDREESGKKEVINSEEKSDTETTKKTERKNQEEKKKPYVPTYTICINKSENENCFPLCGNLSDAQAAVCYYMLLAYQQNIKRKTGAELTEKEAFQFMELLIRCEKREQFEPSWKTMSSKTIVLREDSFQALRDDSMFYFRLADMFYKENPFAEDSQ